MILACLYNAPVVYYTLLIENQEHVFIEQYDHYTKQTYRNRCRIMGGNGVIDLVIPVVKNHSVKTLVRDVVIDYDINWPAIHWKSLQAAYASAPFYEFIQDEFINTYTRRFKYLVDFNMELLEITLRILNTPVEYKKTDSFLPVKCMNDPRESIHPKRDFSSDQYAFLIIPYQQVFSDRFGFIENLSILDLLFNVGPEATSFLRKSISPK